MILPQKVTIMSSNQITYILTHGTWTAEYSNLLWNNCAMNSTSFKSRNINSACNLLLLLSCRNRYICNTLILDHVLVLQIYHFYSNMMLHLLLSLSLPYFDRYSIVWIVHLVPDMSDHVFHKFRLVDEACTIPRWHSPSENTTTESIKQPTIKEIWKMLQHVHRVMCHYPIWQLISEILGRLWR